MVSVESRCSRSRKQDLRPQIFCQISGAKSHGSVKSEGEERCRLFGTVGTKRWCYSRFSWVNSRIFWKRLRWYAKQVGLEDVETIRRLLGEDWWFRLRESLLDVVLPQQYYQVWDRELERTSGMSLGFGAYIEGSELVIPGANQYRRRAFVVVFGSMPRLAGRGA